MAESTFESILRASLSAPSGRIPNSLEMTKPLAELLASCSACCLSSSLFTSPLRVTSCLSLSTSTLTFLNPALSRARETWSFTSGVLARCSVHPMLNASNREAIIPRIPFIRIKSPPIEIPGAKVLDAVLLRREGQVIGSSDHRVNGFGATHKYAPSPHVCRYSIPDKSFLKWAYGVPKLSQGTKSPGNYWQFVQIYE